MILGFVWSIGTTGISGPQEEPAIVAAIGQARPDIVLVAMRSPKNEQVLASRADVERPPHCLIAFDGREERPCDVVHVGEVARLLPGSSDDEWLSRKRAEEEVRDHIAVAAGDLAWAIRVEQAEDHGRQAVVRVKEIGVLLTEPLAHGVGCGEGIVRAVLPEGAAPQELPVIDGTAEF